MPESLPKYVRRFHGRTSLYAVMEVPKEVRQLVGKLRYVKSLGTDSPSRAERLARPVVAQWLRELDQHRRSVYGDDLDREAALWQETIEEARRRDAKREAERRQRAREWFGDENHYIDLEEAAELESQLVERADAIEQAEDPERARAFLDLARGQTTQIAPLFEQRLRERQYRSKTEDKHHRALELLLKRHTVVETIDRKTASVFAREVLLDGSRVPESARQYISAYKTFWDWLERGGITPGPNPWSNLGIDSRHIPTPVGKPNTERREPTEEEAAAFIELLERHKQRFPADPEIARVYALTGLRLGEVANLRVARVEFTEEAAWIHILKNEGKNNRGTVRKVPIVVPEVRQMLERRTKGKEPDSPVWPEIARADGRTDTVSSRFSRRLYKLMPDEEERNGLVGGHGWRHRAYSILSRSGVEEWVQNMFVGHALPELRQRYQHGVDNRLLEAARVMYLPKRST